MNAPLVARPEASEYAPYYGRYLENVPEGDLFEVLATQPDETAALLEEIGEARADYRYALGKWSVKEIVGHLIDTERVFAYRALRFARGDRSALPGFDQDAYVAAAHFDNRPLADLVEEFRLGRRANVRLFRSFDAAALRRSGTANGVEMSVRALLYIIAGHERHHRQILRERYLPGLMEEGG